MYKNNIITIIIPAHNEEASLPKTKSFIPVFVDNILVVNNNSTDKTEEIARNIGAIVINETKKGYGFAYQAGFKNIPENTNIIVTCDADGTYPLNNLDKILDLIIDGDYDFINCSRFPLMDKNSMYWLNRIGNWGLNLWFKILTLKNIKDSQSGMWVFKKDFLNKINLKSGGMPLSEEIKMEAVLSKDIKFREFHIDYYERKGKTKLNAFSDGWTNLKYLFIKRLRIFYRNYKK